jgi:hypothetical protein
MGQIPITMNMSDTNTSNHHKRNSQTFAEIASNRI